MLTPPEAAWRGAHAAHRLPVATLRRIFAVLLYVLAMKMLWAYIASTDPSARLRTQPVTPSARAWRTQASR